MRFTGLILINLSWATSHVSWLNSQQTNVSRSIREKFLDDDADGSHNVEFLHYLTTSNG
jgi:hypothetical protein